MYNGMKVYIDDYLSPKTWEVDKDFYYVKFFFNGAPINRGNKLCYIVFKVRKTDRCAPMIDDCAGTVVTEADGKAHEIYMSGADIGGGQPVDAEVPFCQGD